MSSEWPPTDDPLFDLDDPAAVEREERRREREEKRRGREAKKGKKEPTPPPPPPKPAAPPAPPRTPEQEFWNEDPTPAPPVSGQEPTAPSVGASEPPAPDPGMVERGRRRLLGRRRSKDSVPAPSAADPSKTPPPVAAEPKTEIQPQPPPAAPKEPPAAPASPEAAAPKGAAVGAVPSPGSSADADEPRADPGLVAPAAAATSKGTPAGDAATPPEGDSLGRAALGGAAVAAAGGAAAAAGASDSDPSDPSAPGPPASGAGGEPSVPASGPPPTTGEHPAPGDPGQGTREYAAPPPPPEEPNTGDWHPLERDWDFHDEGDPDMTGAARAGRRRGEDGGNRRGGVVGALLRHPFRILAVIVLLIVLWFLNGLFQPFHGDGHGRVQVTIPKGAGVGEVGDILEKRGVIDGGAILDASTLFQMRVTLAGKRGDLIAGHHTMQKGMSFGGAIDTLSEEPTAPKKTGVVTVTIPEGYHRTETAKLVGEDGLKGNYTKATVKSKYLKPAQYGGKGAKDLEGFLFPDTFELRSGTPVKKLVKLQLEDFKKKIKKVNMKYAKSKNLTVYDVVTIGSLIEGEAGLPKQRKLVSSVIYNRLHGDIPLGLDTTTRFATGNYSKPLTQSELESNSPYNTRKVAGLPPGPISSPGLAALQAAAHPAKTGYIFYVNDPNSCGGLSFSKTEEEFEADVQKYEAAREKAGGNAPSTCGE